MQTMGNQHLINVFRNLMKFPKNCISIKMRILSFLSLSYFVLAEFDAELQSAKKAFGKMIV